MASTDFKSLNIALNIIDADQSSLKRIKKEIDLAYKKNELVYTIVTDKNSHFISQFMREIDKYIYENKNRNNY